VPLSQRDIRDNAQHFAHDWAEASRENADKQTFWNEFFDIFGMKRRRVAAFEEPVKKLGDRRGSIDLFWKGTLIVEHKSRGESLDKAYSQAVDYFQGLKDDELPKYVLVSDFARFRLYDLDEKLQLEFPIQDLPKHIEKFGFISGYTKRHYKDEDPVNITVAEKMGELHDALLVTGYTGHALERLLVRLIYCLFADDTGIFNAKGDFEFFIRDKTKDDGSDTGMALAQIFQTLDTPHDKRQTSLDEDLLKFPHVNGSLFKEPLPIPAFTREMRTLFLDCCEFDWSKVSPAIFGSMFQYVMDGGKRRSLGAHYTSEKNILKVIRGLFLDDLTAEFNAVKSNVRRLTDFHERLCKLRFFDPACGCGNFLIITYRELRLLEIEILKAIQSLKKIVQLESDVSQISKIDVNCVFGIELEEFPARIAEVALWLTDHQMNMRLSETFGQTYVRLPLRESPNIVQGNALRMDWAMLIPPDVAKDNLFILGNPPFIGKQLRTDEQKADMDFLCQPLAAKGLATYGTLDYVAMWYIKATLFISGSAAKVAFVSTNSITQGEQVSALWHFLLSKGVRIHFAHRTFKWSNEARGNAQVFCVIIGFGLADVSRKRLYDYDTPKSEPLEISAANINPYLIDAADLVIPSRNKPLCDVPEISFGNQPNDGGHLLLNDDEKNNLLKVEPAARKFIRKFLGSQEFINGESRWCLWLKDAMPAELRSMPEVMKRVELVKQVRLESKREATRELAATPYLFGYISHPETDYVIIPSVSSERRKFIPIGFVSRNVITSNRCAFVPNATRYHFGVLTSTMHNAWMRQVCGRLKSDYNYSNNIVYNNFPWPMSVTAAQKKKVEAAAEAVLEARGKFLTLDSDGSESVPLLSKERNTGEVTLADLYDPAAMPKELVAAHRKLDAAVEACYRKAAFKSDLERVAFLFALYRQYAEPLTLAAEAATKKQSRKAARKPSGGTSK
jgi:hypothetical protein